ncbi:MAG: nucleoside triphosphate pyrophosphohydrolase [Gammaproteobacteria bacterium]|jgi:ATP diphosphatase|nr:nucleoside triphosphate pyrophosphohydrolase [Chromatiales bacterium]MDP6675636.1 nucleoside triphosphate pyrophosphohydrolase [Gammaproteobacteria bacterium]
MTSIQKLLDIMRSLRDPESGCPWDLEQDFRTIYPFTIEEAYEVADAIDREDWPGLQDELGDLLLQVVFHAQMADERSLFTFADVVNSISAKLKRRHPHVFGDETVDTAAAQSMVWATHKQAEREATGEGGLLDGVAQALPALMRADKLSRRAARVGFDWPDAERVRAKVDEELAELDEARTAGDQAAVTEELGDLLVAIATLARHLGIDPEFALRAGNDKFVRRFQAMEKLIAGNGEDWSDLTPDDMEERWQSVKRSE